MTDDAARLQTLLAWREEVEGQVGQLKEQQAQLLDEISKKEAQLRNINQLLESEGCLITEYRVADISKGGSLADRAFAILKETDKPWYYRELAEKLREIGVYISGNDRAANLLAHIGRDERFQRVKRGTYGLTEWQIKILAKKRPGRSKEKESPQSSNNESAKQAFTPLDI